jgi:hypothetical protein
MRIETTAKLMLFTALMLAVCACGNTPKPQIAQRQPDKQVVAAPEPAEDPDPNMRVVAQNAPCFSSDSGRTYKATFDNIALVHRLARDNDLEALSTLETRGIFVMLSPGTIFQTKDG